ncbi:hypothetical protein REPUB_Repub09cG0050400 [Reevesia pubescens]
MENKNGIMDVSCFLLVEDSGDSEQCQSMEIAADDDNHEDDAESCSCDTISTDQRALDDFYEVILQLDQDFIDCNEAVTGRSSCNKWFIDEALGYISADEHAEYQEPRFGTNLSREVMDGMEDRLFWETCMEVGYP